MPWFGHAVRLPSAAFLPTGSPVRPTTLIAIAVLLVPASGLAQSLSLGSSVVPEDFDSLASSGTATTLPTGWYLAESGTNANTSYAADAGGTASGNTYSYGTGSSSERALGLLQSNSLTPTVGVRISNETGSVLTELGIRYRGEQWRLGTAGREDRLDVQYSLDATSLTTGSWVNIDALDFVAPITTGTAGSALDGNLPANQRELSHTLAGLSVAAGGTLWLRWIDFNASNADDGLAIDDVQFTPPGGGVDVAPAVGSSVPANNATGVAVGADLSLRFTEPVTLAAGALGLQCGGQAVAFTQSGSGRDYTLDPTADLPFSAACVLGVTAAAVSDLDGSIDAMLANYTASFTTAAAPVDVAPTVQSTVPVNNAGNIAVNSAISIVFSEPVTVTDAWYGIVCTVSGSVAAQASGGPASYLLTPSASLQQAETCTVTVFAAQVADQDGRADALASNYVFSFGTSAGAGDYYRNVDASSQAALRSTLHATIDDHTVFPYSGGTTNTWTILEAADQDPSNPSRVLDAYLNCSFAKGTDRSGQSGGATCGSFGTRRYNREHTWPNSLGFGSQTGSDGNPYAPYTDTHMLYLTDETYNADRGNKPYADCNSGCGERATLANPVTGGGTGGDSSNYVQTPDGNAGSFEVWDARKGDIARAVLYMDIRYEGGTHGISGQTEPDLVLTDNRALIVITSSSPAYMGLLSTLLAWHQADPPDARERARNDVVFSWQGNRNPFIDHPEWAACLFQAQCAATPPSRVFANGFEQP
jgi:endonuclease I